MRDPESGEILTIPDGEWIIVFGTFGWLGYVSLMGLLAGPLVFMLWRRIGRSRRAAPCRRALALILAITMVDMLINDPDALYLADRGGDPGHCRGARLGVAAAGPRGRRAIRGPDGPLSGTGRRP